MVILIVQTDHDLYFTSGLAVLLLCYVRGLYLYNNVYNSKCLFLCLKRNLLSFEPVCGCRTNGRFLRTVTTQISPGHQSGLIYTCQLSGISKSEIACKTPIHRIFL